MNNQLYLILEMNSLKIIELRNNGVFIVETYKLSYTSTTGEIAGKALITCKSMYKFCGGS